MTQLIVRLVTRGAPPERQRGRLGKAAGIVGIASNLLLFVLKLLIGLFSNSISIMADAVNNLSDCASSLITLVGFKLAGIPADEQHPYGHARYEYISGLAVSCLIIAIGVQFLLRSVDKTLHPAGVDFSPAIAVVLLLSMAIKLWQGRFNHVVGEKIGSPSLQATAVDSRNDVLTTGAVLVASLVEYFSSLRLDGPMGIAVALFILYSGIGLIRDTLNPLLGMAPDGALVALIQDKIRGYPSVVGIHDLMVHNYGPGRCFASVHVEVPASQDIMVSHDIIDGIERDFARDLDISLVIHLDPVVTDDPRLDALRVQLDAFAREIDGRLSIHDFRMVAGQAHVNLIFDVTMPPRFKLTDQAFREQFAQKVKTLGEQYRCVITIDRSYISTTGQDKGTE